MFGHLSFCSIGSSPGREAKQSGRTYRKDWRCCRFNLVLLPHGPLLRPVRHRRTCSVTSFPLIAPVVALTSFHSTPSEKGIAFTRILIISVTLEVVAVPEGLPLAVTLALAFATKRMTAEKLLVRILGTGGEGAFTQWVWVELIESSETICPANTHQVHAEFI